MLYKYRNIGDLNKNILDTNLLSLIKNGEIYFSSPDDFNDPFDCKATFNLNASDKELLMYMLRANISRKNAIQMIQKIGTKNIQNIAIDKILNTKENNLKVFCLTENYKNLLMWSHYGQQHFGVCVGINTYPYEGKYNIRIQGEQIVPINEQYPINFLPVLKVMYPNDRPKSISITEIPNTKFDQFIFNKSIDWKYEDEYRIVISTQYLKKNPIKIKRSEIKEIIFGLRTPETLINEVMEITKDIKNIKYYKIYNLEDSYLLEKMEITFA